MALRTEALAWNDQYRHPVAASREYTYPISVPTKMRPAATVGCPAAETPWGYPKAHRSFNRGISAAVMPAVRAWKRVFARSAPQPFHAGPPAGSVSGGLPGQWLGMPEASPDWAVPKGRPLSDSATLRLATSLNFRPCIFMVPVESAS